MAEQMESGIHKTERQVQKYYQALAKKRLGQNTDAEELFRSLIEASAKAPDQKTQQTGSAVSSSAHSESSLTHYLVGLGYLGLGQKEDASAEFKKALEIAPDSLGAKTELARLQ